MEAKDIARVCHEANCALCIINGDQVLPNWDILEDAYKGSAISGVKFAQNNDKTPEEQHVAWMNERLLQGWKYGPVLDRTAKIHPNLIPYKQLPENQKLKDKLFQAIVKALSEK